jgi:hypothetical protein
VEYRFDYSTFAKEASNGTGDPDVERQIRSRCEQSPFYRGQCEPEADDAQRCKCVPKQLQGKDQQPLTDTFPPFGARETVRFEVVTARRGASGRHVFSCTARTRRLDGYCMEVVIPMEEAPPKQK